MLNLNYDTITYRQQFKNYEEINMQEENIATNIDNQTKSKNAPPPNTMRKNGK